MVGNRELLRRRTGELPCRRLPGVASPAGIKDGALALLMSAAVAVPAVAIACVVFGHRTGDLNRAGSGVESRRRALDVLEGFDGVLLEAIGDWDERGVVRDQRCGDEGARRADVPVQVRAGRDGNDAIREVLCFLEFGDRVVEDVVRGGDAGEGGAEDDDVERVVGHSRLCGLRCTELRLRRRRGGNIMLKKCW